MTFEDTIMSVTIENGEIIRITESEPLPILQFLVDMNNLAENYNRIHADIEQRQKLLSQIHKSIISGNEKITSKITIEDFQNVLQQSPMVVSTFLNNFPEFKILLEILN